LRLAAEHLGRLGADGEVPDMADCESGADFFGACAEGARQLDAWHEGGCKGARPPGRLRRLEVPKLSHWDRLWARVPLDVIHDPDGRPRRLSRRRAY
jgi:hypothetical protein